MKMKPISERLFEEFDRIGVSSYKVAKMSGVAQPTFTKYRKDGMQPTRDVLDKICAVLPVDRTYIEFGSRNNDMENPESFPAVHEDATQYGGDDRVADLLSEQIRQQQKMIDHLMDENMKLMSILHARLTENQA